MAQRFLLESSYDLHNSRLTFHNNRPKPKNPKMSENSTHWIGFDLGGTKMLAVVLDEKFEVIGTCRKKTKGHEGMESGLNRINAVIEGALENAGITPDQVGGLGIGCPGPLDLEKGMIREAPNLGWSKVPIRKSIHEKFGFDVAVGNDVDLGVYGEYMFGAAKKARCVVGVFPGTGIGGGCVMNGQLLTGANCTAMEIGHIPVSAESGLDRPGVPATLESIASRLAISGAAAQAVFRGQAPNLAEIAGTDLSNIRSAQLAKAIKQGDTVIATIVETAAARLAMGVVTLIHLLAPDIVVLGGGLVEAMPDLYLKTVREEVDRLVLPSLKDIFKIVPAKLGDDAAVMGAAALARSRFAPQLSAITS